MTACGLLMLFDKSRWTLVNQSLLSSPKGNCPHHQYITSITSARTSLETVPKSLGHSHVTRFPASLMSKIFPFALQSSHLCSSPCISKSKSSQPWSSAGSGRWVKCFVSVCGVQLARRKLHLSRERGQTSLHHKETWQREGMKGSHFSANFPMSSPLPAEPCCMK